MARPPVSAPLSSNPDRPRSPQRATFWRRLGGGSLSISLIVHGIILAIGIVWVVSIIPPPPEKKVDFMPPSGGGGSPAASEVKNKKRSMSLQSNAPRMAAVGAESKFALPEPDTSSEMSSLGALGGGGLSAGLGGGGSGGGKGEGTGKGFGNGMGPGLGGGGGKVNPFGMIDPNANALVGTFYDLKQTKDGKPTGCDNTMMQDVLHDFSERGWKEKDLDKFFRPQVKLYQTKIYMPTMSAGAAPAAFQCEKQVKPSFWVVVYRGSVTPPRTGRYRFVGFADNVLMVRFNRKVVFDYGISIISGPVRLLTGSGGSLIDVLKGETKNRDIESKLRRAPSNLPMTFYPYEGISKSPFDYNASFGGLAVGPEFEARAGTTYPIEIMTGEMPGSWFNSWLMIEEKGQTYQKAPNGSPILPVFRLDSHLPEDTKTIPVDPDGPVWKIVGGPGEIEI